MKRQTAYIFWIKDISNAVPEMSSDGFKMFNVCGIKAKRVNILAAVVDVYANDAGNYLSLTLDDGSGQVRAKAWDADTSSLSGFTFGDIVLLVGLLYESNSEVFIRPEIVRKMDSEWALARKRLLTSLYGKPSSEGMLKVSEEMIDEPVEPTMEARGNVFSIVSESAEQQVPVEELIAKSGMQRKLVEKVVEELIKDGEIFSPKAGFVSVL